MTINHYSPKLINTLNPFMDVWTPTGGICATMVKDLQDGAIRIDPTDRLGYYGGGFVNSSPDAMRANGWLAALYETKHYSVFAYHQRYTENRPYVCFAPGSDGPATTPALEGLRDGFEDFAYWYTLDHLLTRGEAEPAKRWSAEEQIAVARQLREREYLQRVR